ncbi:NAD(P)-binding domain-containing protein [Pelagibacterium lacus]|uniref:NAD(P)/FAD-dependent oxidoreductase n=1 Tax=Pelagibacterium lacus TaxID=2282655 RepID=A0A369W4M0_9HYPH|nr:NAD(P)/FAD-dependent oxidoreductase [Pelagibacterium lacus]RDE09273.1 NAD(P)/FAD-dependent oxidoreductase [Pelagibacterium lacus]
MTSTAAGLSALEHKLNHDLSLLELPSKSWVPQRMVDGRPVYDTVVVGGGMCGLVALACLKLLGIDNIIAFDRAEEGREGPWVTFARMRTLRSPKQLTGPALGLPALTFRAWFEAQFGEEEWEKLNKIPRIMWMDYLVWYRKVLDLPVQNRTEVLSVTHHAEGILALRIARHGQDGEETVYARHVVLATGRDGLGAPFVPPFVQSVDRKFWAHSAENIDFEALKGKRVGVVGAGASAMDNAATALEAGCGSLDMFVRRADLPRINKFTGISSQGVVNGFAGLPDEWKWRFLHHTIGAQTPPPRDSTLRVSSHANARFHLASPVLAFEAAGDEVQLTTPKGTYTLDFVIFATGFNVSLEARAELESFADNIAYWSDRYAPEPGTENLELSSSPYLGPGFEFQEKVPGATPGLNHIHSFNYPATLSHGKLSGDIPAVSDGGKRLARAIARNLFVEDREIHFQNLVAYDVPELQGDEWVDFDASAAEEQSA